MFNFLYKYNLDLIYENTNVLIYIVIILIVSFLLLGLNYIFSVQNPDPLKIGPFECGLSSFNQSRVTFSVLFVLIAILFLPFDLEVSCLLPFGLCFYNLQNFGIIVITIFLFLLTLGFVFEIYQEALKIHSKQDSNFDNVVVIDLFDKV
jgi:NADH:ubiquinone oxidoreductase subunit 3 (subunit A)